MNAQQRSEAVPLERRKARVHLAEAEAPSGLVIPHTNRRETLGREPRSSHPSQRRHQAPRRIFDFVVALVVLVTALPLMLLIALLVKLDSPGPVLFRQRRIGKDLRQFCTLKFRTMREGSTSEAHQRYIARLASGEAESDGLKKLTDDPRVTSVGAVLRKLSLDELPQLFNVLMGQMSLVGPRPAIEYELEHYAPQHFDRFAVLPGITGLWQTSGRNGLGFSEMLDLDTEYARSATFLTDVRILARTPRAAVSRTA